MSLFSKFLRDFLEEEEKELRALNNNQRMQERNCRNERRADNRVALLYRPVLIETDEFAGFCLLRNLSSGGMRGTVYVDLAAGQTITVQFRPNLIVSGLVAWSQEKCIGVEFGEEINVKATLQELGSRYIDGMLNRAPRLQIQCDAEVIIDKRPVTISVHDISQRGIKAAVPFVRPGDEVVVRLGGMESRKALVRWTQSGMAGLNFIRPIGFEELAKWVIGRQLDDETIFDVRADQQRVSI